MAGPINLNADYPITNFPTWHAGKSTKFCVKNLGSTQAKVKVAPILSTQAEEVYVPPSQTFCIDRNWAGNIIAVGNIGSSPVQVWTE